MPDPKLYVYGDVPPEPAKVTLPVELPLQSTLMTDVVAIESVAGSVTTTFAVLVQPLASVILYVYVPAESVVGF